MPSGSALDERTSTLSSWSAAPRRLRDRPWLQRCGGLVVSTSHDCRRSIRRPAVAALELHSASTEARVAAGNREQVRMAFIDVLDDLLKALRRCWLRSVSQPGDCHCQCAEQ